jgi:Xaa-Pro aminopeptidase
MPTTDRIIEKNNLVLLTVAPRYEGCQAAIGRMMIVGKPEDENSRTREARQF